MVDQAHARFHSHAYFPAIMLIVLLAVKCHAFADARLLLILILVLALLMTITILRFDMMEIMLSRLEDEPTNQSQFEVS